MNFDGGCVEKTQLTYCSTWDNKTVRSAGAINTLLFWLFWEILRLSPVLELVSETGVWAFAWVMSCTIAHFTHRYFTFDGRKDVKSTMIGGFHCLCCWRRIIDNFIQFINRQLSLPIRIIFIINMLISGLFTWASMRWFVFEYKE